MRLKIETHRFLLIRINICLVGDSTELEALAKSQCAHIIYDFFLFFFFLFGAKRLKMCFVKKKLFFKLWHFCANGAEQLSCRHHYQWLWNKQDIWTTMCNIPQS